MAAGARKTWADKTDPEESSCYKNEQQIYLLVMKMMVQIIAGTLKLIHLTFAQSNTKTIGRYSGIVNHSRRRSFPLRWKVNKQVPQSRVSQRPAI